MSTTILEALKTLNKLKEEYNEAPILLTKELRKDLETYIKKFFKSSSTYTGNSCFFTK